MNGGAIVARVLRDRGVRFLFTLCGGHISPILVESKRVGIRVIDVRHEVNAVFAADAVARLTGKRPGRTQESAANPEMPFAACQRSFNQLGLGQIGAKPDLSRFFQIIQHAQHAERASLRYSCP
jgi:hypothetical protein